MSKYYAVFISLVFFQILSAQTLSLDPTFGIGGRVLHSFDTGGDDSRAIVIQNDGKILVCGLNEFSINGNLYLARYNTDGSMDITFGNNGFVLTPLACESGGNRNMKLLPDGKILVTAVMTTSINIGFLNFGTARYNSDGSFDTTFGINGIVITDIAALGNDANGIEVQSDGKIIVAGNTYTGTSGSKTTLVRYLTNGEADVTFGTNGDGKVILNSIVPNTSQFVWDIKILDDDSILLGVSTNESNPNLKNIAILKVNSDGTPDTTFGTNGFVLSDFGAYDLLYSIDEYQGSIIMAGYSRYLPPGYNMILAKYLSNGVPDTSFGINGKVIINKDAASLGDGLLEMKVQSNGKILCSGWTGAGDSKDGLLIQFNADGSIDAGFNGIGYITTDFNDIENTNFSFAIQPDGKIVCTGSAGIRHYQDSTLIRYNVSTLSTIPFNAASRFTVYPNPFVDKITIQSNQAHFSNAKVELFDVNGRKLQSFTTKNTTSLSLPINANLSKGNYFLKVIDGEKIETFKIVKN